MTFSVFLSYARADQALVERLAAEIERLDKNVWWDRYLESGSDFSNTIEERLRTADAVVVCWSKNASASRWVRDEASVAADMSKLKCVSLDATIPPIGFRQYHAVDIKNWFENGDRETLDMFLRTLSSPADPSQGPQPLLSAAALESSAPQPGQKKTSWPIDPRMAMAGAALLGGAVIGGVTLLGHNSASIDKEAGALGLPSTQQEVQADTNTVAILPFRDLSPERDQQYFSDGVAEEILNALAKVSDLRVTGRTSSFIFRDGKEDANSIGRYLGVAHILEGSVRKHGARLRISARLIRTDTGLQVWADNFDGDVDDVFDLQEEISREITRNLSSMLVDAAPERADGASLLPNPPVKRIADPLTGDYDAYNLFLQGRAAMRDRPTEANIQKTLEYLNAAVVKDPTFAAAWASLASAYLTFPGYTLSLDAEQMLQKAEDAAITARRLDPMVASPLVTLAGVYSLRGEKLRAMRLLEEARALEPNNSAVEFELGALNAFVGRTAAAIAHHERVAVLDPAYAVNLDFLARVKLNADELDEARTYAQKAAELGWFPAYEVLAWVASKSGDADAASEYLMTMHDIAGGQVAERFQAREIWSNAARAYFHNDPAARDGIINLLKEYLQAPEARVTPVIVNFFARMGESELFFDSYPKSLMTGGTTLVSLWDGTASSSEIRRHPDFPAFADATGMIDLWRAYGWPDRCSPPTGDSGSALDFTCE